MAAMKRGRTKEGLGVFGPAGCVEWARDDSGWVLFHKPIHDPGPDESHCRVLEMCCDASPIWSVDELPFGPGAADDEVYAVLEGVYAKETSG